MHALDFSPWILVPMGLSIVAMLTTLSRVFSAYADRDALLAARRRYSDARYWELYRQCGASVAREWVRMLKHGICITGICIAAASPQWAPQGRNICFALVSLFLMVNSLRDRRLQQQSIEAANRTSAIQ